VSDNPLWGVLGIVAVSLIGIGLVMAPSLASRLGERRLRFIEMYVFLPIYSVLMGWRSVSHFLEGDQTQGLIGLGAVLLVGAIVIHRRLRGNSATPGSGASE
jgi:hypothetical protein